MNIRPSSVHNLALLLLVLVAAFGVVGCSAKLQPIRSDKPTFGYRSQIIEDLMALPPPEQQFAVAVYKFRDQSGQYKQTSVGAVNYSTAVTQGATSMLIKALEDAGRGAWFTVVERESLPNLLNERKIIRQTRMQYMSPEDLQRLPPLPAMIYAPVILDGGVIAYETNLLTGGLGAKYLGIGADSEFQRDTVTVSLRAISVKDGRVLKSVETRKTILSVKVDASVFKFVGVKDLLEAEAGFSSNEPPQMAVQEAIEGAVYSLVLEGVADGLWSFKDQELGKRLIRKYEDEKQVRPVPIYGSDGQLEGFRRPGATPTPPGTLPPAAAPPAA
jgi:curli production assembly/transport component CsgG